MALWALLPRPAVANPFSTYGMTENYTVDNLNRGQVLIDMRTYLQTPDTLTLPALGVVWAVTDGLEVGTTGPLELHAVGSPGWRPQVGAFNPWLKLTLPVPAIKLGLLAAAEIPTDGTPLTAGLEVLYQTATPLADLSVNLGYANTPTFTGPLYYLNLQGTRPLVEGLDLVVELSALSLHLTQRLGLQASLTPQWDADVSLALREDAATGQITAIPQLGASVTF